MVNQFAALMAQQTSRHRLDSGEKWSLYVRTSTSTFLTQFGRGIAVTKWRILATRKLFGVMHEQIMF